MVRPGTAKAESSRQVFGSLEPAVPGLLSSGISQTQTATQTATAPRSISPLAATPASGGVEARGVGGEAHNNSIIPTASGTGSKEPAYPAIVPSIFHVVRLLGINKNPTNETCGKIRAKIQCSHDAGHRPYFKHEHCNDPLCPVCFKKFVSRQADRITERLWGYHEIYQTPLAHVTFWDKADHEPYPDMTTAMRAGLRLLKQMGATAGSFQWHPFRIKQELLEPLREYRISRGLSKSTGFWEMARDDVLELGSLDAYVVRGDHFHGIISGRLRDVRAYYKDTGCGYDKIRYMQCEGDIHRLAYYISSHSAYEFGKQSVRYFGNASYSRLGCTLIDKRVEDVCCDVCRARMQEMFTDADGNPVGLSRDHVTRIVKVYKYWKRTKKKKKKKSIRCSLL